MAAPHTRLVLHMHTNDSRIAYHVVRVPHGLSCLLDVHLNLQVFEAEKQSGIVRDAINQCARVFQGGRKSVSSTLRNGLGKSKAAVTRGYHGVNGAAWKVRRSITDGVSKAHRLGRSTTRRVRRSLGRVYAPLEAFGKEVLRKLRVPIGVLTPSTPLGYVIVLGVAFLVYYDRKSRPADLVPPAWIPSNLYPAPATPAAYTWLKFPNIAAMTGIAPVWVGAPYARPKELFFPEWSASTPEALGDAEIPPWARMIDQRTKRTKRQQALSVHPDKIRKTRMSIAKNDKYEKFISEANVWAYDALDFRLRELQVIQLLPFIPKDHGGMTRTERLIVKKRKERALIQSQLDAVVAKFPAGGAITSDGRQAATNVRHILATPEDLELLSHWYRDRVPLRQRVIAKVVQDVLPCRGSFVWDALPRGFVNNLGKGESDKPSWALEKWGPVSIPIDPPGMRWNTKASSKLFDMDHEHGAAEKLYRRIFLNRTSSEVDQRCLPEIRGELEELGGDRYLASDLAVGLKLALGRVGERMVWELRHLGAGLRNHGRDRL